MDFAGGLESGSKLEQEVTKEINISNFLNSDVFGVLAIILLFIMFIVGVILLTNRIVRKDDNENISSTKTASSTNHPKQSKNMSCRVCGQKNIQIINTIQQKEKDHPVLLIVGVLSFIFCFICIIACIIILDQKGMTWELFLLNPIASITAFFFKVGVIAILLRQLMPYKTINVLYVVCKECGEIEKFTEIEEKENKDVIFH